MADREPIAGSSRPSGEMTFPTHATPHAEHDLVLIAAATDRDAEPGLRAAADAQMASCPECTALGADLRLLSEGLTDLPTTSPVPRDMRLTPDQAARLGRGGRWRRLLRPFGANGLPGLRPIAGALTTLGLAGILLAAFPLGLGGGAASLAQDSMTSGAGYQENVSAAPAAVPAPTAGPVAPGSDMKGLESNAGASPPAAARDTGTYFGTADGGPGGTRALAGNVVPGSPASQPSPLVSISLVLVASGIGLFALVFVARRTA